MPVPGLTFVGLGLYDARDVSLKGLDVIRAADVVCLERYTSVLAGSKVAELEALYGKRVEVLQREDVEDGRALLEAARASEVVLLVPGDSMAATTHVELRVRATKLGIATRIVHGASIVGGVAGLLGLQSYKFGRASTVPFPQPGFEPDSPYDVLAGNLQRGLHTLLLLDIDAARERYMTANEGIRLLVAIEKRRGKNLFVPETLACVVARAGSDAPGVFAGPAERLAETDFGGPLHTLAVPGELHFMEEEALRVLARWV